MSPRDGLERQKAGDLAGAEAIYRAALDSDPGDVMAATLLGALWCQTGRFEAGTALLRETIETADLAMSHFVLGQVLAGRGHAGEAADAFRNSIERAPSVPAAYTGLGQALAALGDLAGAAAAYADAIRLDPNHPDAYRCAGLLLHQLGRPRDALGHLRVAAKLGPASPEVWAALGNAYLALRDHDAALDALRQEVALAPDAAPARLRLGNALHAAGLFQDAAEAARAAIALQPGFADAHANLANALLAMLDYDTAEAAVRCAVRLEPASAAYRSNLGTILTARRRVPEALAAQRQALAIDPGFADARYNHAITLLLDGQWEAGWQHYESRWALPGNPPRPFAEPLWQGEPLAGRTILLHAEQGLGDMLQMARYVALAAARGGPVVLEVHAPLVRLFANLPGVRLAVPLGTALPPFDVHCPMFSLPFVFGTRPDAVPSAPYLGVPPGAQVPERCLRALTASRGLRVGLVWGGGDQIGAHVNRDRSVPVAQLAPLARIPGIALFSLQKDPDGTADGITDLMNEVTDFADTAALVAHLDLVIGVDTATIHLAAAMGKPVWLMSRFSGCWRWLLHRPDSPWYPGLRIYRQDRPADWSGVVQQIIADMTHETSR